MESFLFDLDFIKNYFYKYFFINCDLCKIFKFTLPSTVTIAAQIFYQKVRDFIKI